jgi:hypothetical protein
VFVVLEVAGAVPVIVGALTRVKVAGALVIEPASL